MKELQSAHATPVTDGAKKPPTSIRRPRVPKQVMGAGETLTAELRILQGVVLFRCQFVLAAEQYLVTHYSMVRTALEVTREPVLRRVLLSDMGRVILLFCQCYCDVLVRYVHVFIENMRESYVLYHFEYKFREKKLQIGKDMDYDLLRIEMDNTHARLLRKKVSKSQL